MLSKILPALIGMEFFVSISVLLIILLILNVRVPFEITAYSPFFPYLALNMLFDYFSLAVTVAIARLIVRYGGFTTLTVGIFIDALLVYVFSALTYWLAFDWMMGAGGFSPIGAYLSYLATVDYSMRAILSYLLNAGLGILYFYKSVYINFLKLLDLNEMGGYQVVFLSSEIVLIVVFTSSLPTMVHLIILLAFLFLKLSTPGIKRTTELIAAAFYEASGSPIKILGGALMLVSAVLFRLI